MPRGKKKEHHYHKGRSNNAVGGGGTGGSDDETETLDTVSAVSSQSDQQATITDGSEDAEVDETTAQENLEAKLRSHVDGISQKSAKGRMDSLQSLKAILSQKYLFNFVLQNKMTLSDCLERSLKKGKGDEQSVAAICGILILIQLGASDEREEIFRSFCPLLKVIFSDASSSSSVRSACAEALGLCAFIAAEEYKDIQDVMTSLENVFKQTYIKCALNCSPDVSAIHNSALAAWTLLLSILPDNLVQDIVETHLCKLSEVLTSTDMDLRITAGEAVALLYEKSREVDEDFEGEGFDNLCLSLKALSTECNKYRAKKDRRQQKSSFREILSAVDSGDFSKQRIKVNAYDTVIIDSWTRKTHYNALCHVLGSGMNIHLQENDLLRDVFNLGPSVSLDSLPASKSSKSERHMIHDAAFKARTKCRKKMRDMKSVVATGD